jgi:hypothetical protein
MATETLPSTTATKKLVAAWAEAKDRERKANATRLDVEEKLFKALEKDIPDKGSVRVEGTGDVSLKITCGFTDKWNQDQLQDIRANWPDEYPPFPFKEELKPEGKSVTYLRENIPTAYKLIEVALTQDPRKPAFTLD